MSGVIEARQAIQQIIENWDAAYINKDVDKYLENIVPDHTYETCRQKWAAFMQCAEYLHSRSIIKDIDITFNKAIAVINVHEEFMMKTPNSNLIRWLLKHLPRVMFKSDNVRQLTWIKSSESWLCQSDKVLSSKVRLRIKR